MSIPIRVLCVMSTLDRGGAESMCMNLYRHINREKVQFDFIKHTQGKGAFEDEILTLGGKIYAAPRYKIYNHLSYTRWWRVFLKQHPEYCIVHGHFFTISSIYLGVAKSMGRTTVGHIHASGFENYIKAYLVSRISAVTDSPLACSLQAGHWAYGERPFVVLKNGLNTDAFRYNPELRASVRQSMALGNCLTLGTVANLSSVKNPMGLIDVFLAVRKVRPEARLIWAGEGDQRQSIETRLEQEGIKDFVKLLGARNDVPALLQAMDAFLLPSLSEGLPVSVIEAQAAGLPCYISDRVTKEVDITGLCRFLPIDQPKAWADAIVCETTSREDTSTKIKAAGYDIDNTAQWLEGFYLNLVNKKQ